MANEAVLIYETEVPIPFTCANGTGIEKGTVLRLNDPATVVATSGDNEVVIGIAAEEKIANDGMTKIGVYLRGIFKMVVDAGDTTTVGQDVVVRGANTVGLYDTLDGEIGLVIGKALETGAAGESVLVLVGK